MRPSMKSWHYVLRIFDDSAYDVETLLVVRTVIKYNVFSTWRYLSENYLQVLKTLYFKKPSVYWGTSFVSTGFNPCGHEVLVATSRSTHGFDTKTPQTILGLIVELFDKHILRSSPPFGRINKRKLKYSRERSIDCHSSSADSVPMTFLEKELVLHILTCLLSSIETTAQLICVLNM